MKPKKMYLIFTFILFTIIFYFSVLYSKPLIPEQAKISFFDKIEHLIVYFLLSFLIYKSTNKTFLSIFLAGFYGIFMEALQYTTPYRTFDIFDIASNYIGAFFILIFNIFNVKSKEIM